MTTPLHTMTPQELGRWIPREIEHAVKCGMLGDATGEMAARAAASSYLDELVARASALPKVKRSDVIDSRPEWTPYCNDPVLIVRASAIQVTEDPSDG